ncbi:SDR family NAD(P)-dependent oxidoreductase [Micromonospora chersina]|uniref:SDR family NAD(P)-dependent oxidoreductase n=1 Tax=Micromonospora chersina TaxID=47854 RepID=UPI00371FB9C8
MSDTPTSAILTRRIVLVAGPSSGFVAAVVRNFVKLDDVAVVCEADCVDEVRQALAFVEETHGRLDILINAIDTNEPARVAHAISAMAVPVMSHGSGRSIVHVMTGPADQRTLAEAVRELAAEHGEHVRINAVTMEQSRIEPHLGLTQVINFLASETASGVTGQVLALANPQHYPTSQDAADEPSSDTANDSIVIVGMGLVVPGANSPEEFWRLLNAGKPVFHEDPTRLDIDDVYSADPAAADKTSSRAHGWISGFLPHPKLREEIDTGVFTGEEYTALWLRHSVLTAMENVTVRPEDRQLFAVGLTPDGSHHMEHTLVAAGAKSVLEKEGFQLPGTLSNLLPLASGSPEDVLPYRIARMAVPDFPDDGEIVVVDTACSSSLYSIDIGLRALETGEADVALCGGAFALQSQGIVLFSKLRGLSRSGQIRSLDRDADGVLFSDGAAVVVLKRRSRAVADGDPILGHVEGFGGSSDGHGKAIYTPSADGQCLALGRAWHAADIKPDDVDWIVAHGTGTRTGDRVEMTALGSSAGASRSKRWTMTSNKAIIGHTGWAAGAINVIHALLAMRHGTIPAQPQFAEVPDGLQDSVYVPTHPLPWPSHPGRRRTVGVSAMGFGGTNGHIILADRPRANPTPATCGGPALEDPVVIVRWSAHLPGNPNSEQIARWLAGQGANWPATFGEHYDRPSVTEARLAPSTIAAMDRSQLMALRCATDISGEWTQDAELRSRTGVFVGHTGPTHFAAGRDLRIYLDRLAGPIAASTGMDSDRFRAAVYAMTPPTNEDAYPGIMPNIIAARVVQRLDLHGPNMTIDAGRDSVNCALATAIRYLHGGILDMAVVLGVNATTDYLHPADVQVAEAAIGFLLTRRSVAMDRGLEILGHVGLATDESRHRDARGGPTKDRCYRGAEGAVAVLRALHTPQRKTTIAPVEDAHTPAIVVAASGGGCAEDDTLSEAEPGEIGDLSRHSLRLHPVLGRSVRAPVPGLPAGSLIVTDNPSALRGVHVPAGSLVVAPRCVQAVELPFAVQYLERPEDLEPCLRESGRSFNQVRVIIGGQRTNETLSEAVFALHDLAFLAAKLCAPQLDSGGCYAFVALAAADDGLPAPHVGLFSGLVRSLTPELTGCLMFGLVTDSGDTTSAITQLADESARHRNIPVAYHVGGVRMELVLCPAEPSSSEIDLPPQPVIVATGGARGLTAHLVDELVDHTVPRSVWLLGSGPAPDMSVTPKELPSRADAIRTMLVQYPSESVAALNRRYDSEVQEVERIKVLKALELRCGSGKVHYRQCDVLDQDAVQRVISEIIYAEGGIDILVHGAGLTRSAGLSRKGLADFRQVRDVKVRGYGHIRSALGDRQPALWCSISSIASFALLPGEPDYFAGNEFLMLAAAQARAVHHRDEVAFASALWTESGMAAASEAGSTFLSARNQIGQMTDAQGREFFRAELRGRGGPGLVTTWIGAADWAALEQVAPGFRSVCERAAEAEKVTLAGDQAEGACVVKQAFLTEPSQRDGDEWSWTFEVGLDKHFYLHQHLVDSRPTVPGTFILEMGAEAAAQLAPGMVPVRLSNVVLSRFIRAAQHRWPLRLKVIAVRRSNQIRVRVLSSGTGLLPEREHARMVVHLANSHSIGGWVPPVTAGRIDVPNVYEVAGTTVELSGVFSALQLPRLEEDGGSADLLLPRTLAQGVFSQFLLPSITLDCMLRTTVLDGRQPGCDLPVAVPTRITSVEFYTSANDVELAAQWPEGLSLRHWFQPGTGEDICALANPDGRMLLQAKGMTGVTRGRFDPRTGTWRP